MESILLQDEQGTHIEWKHDCITATMIDWFWSNMEKGMLLWHPNQHEPLIWYKAPKHGTIVDSVHIAPQTWKDGTRQELYIKAMDLLTLPDEIKSMIQFEHCIVVGGYNKDTIEDGEPFAYRIHQWTKTDYGVVGKSSAIDGTKKATLEDGKVWAEHCTEEIGNWGVFLPELYNLYRVVLDTRYNPFADLTVERAGKIVRYKYMP